MLKQYLELFPDSPIIYQLYNTEKQYFGKVKAATKEELLSHKFTGNELHISLGHSLRGLASRMADDLDYSSVLLIDLDTPITEQELSRCITHYKPHMVVQSSPGKYHMYWKTYPISKQYKQARDTVIKALSYGILNSVDPTKYQTVTGDLNFCSFSHLVRVPGFERTTKSGELYTPEIVHSVPNPAPVDILALAAKQDIISLESTVDKLIRAYSKKKNQYIEAILLNSPELEASVEVLADNLAESVGLGQGARNDTLYSVCSGLLQSKTMDEVVTYITLLNSKFSPPLSEKEVQTIINSAVNRVQHQESVSVEVANELSDALKTLPCYEITKEQQDFLKLLGIERSGYFKYDLPAIHTIEGVPHLIAMMVEQKHYPYLLKSSPNLYQYCVESQSWRTHKVGDFKGLVKGMIQDCVHDLLVDPLKQFNGYALRLAAKKGSISLQTFWANYYSLCSGPLFERVRAIISHTSIAETYLEFNHNKYQLSLNNGVLDLPTGKVVKGVMANLSTYNLGYNYSPGSVDQSKLEKWMTVIDNVTCQDKELQEFLQDLFGYSIGGEISDQKLYLHVGIGANGKSTILYALQKMLGNYTALLSPDLLVKSKTAKEITRIPIKLKGKRVGIIEDALTDNHFDPMFLKTLTSETMVGRALYAEEENITNHTKIHVALNNMPELNGGDMASERRLCVIPYLADFSEKRSDFSVIDFIDNSLPEILHWAMIGYKRCMERYEKTQTYLNYNIRALTEELEDYRDDASLSLAEAIKKIGPPAKLSEGKCNLYSTYQIKTVLDYMKDEEGLKVVGYNTFNIGRTCKSKKLGLKLFKMGATTYVNLQIKKEYQVLISDTKKPELTYEAYLKWADTHTSKRK